MSKLALLGGEKAVTADPGDIFNWPIITKEDEEAVLEVLRAGKMSGTDVTEQFEKEFAAWQGAKYALGCNNGTNALHSAMWACGVGRGTEIIGPSVTYWASVMPALNLGAAINFADIDPQTLTIDPGDIEHRISKNTKAIVVVHLYGHPANMDRIMAVAHKHKVKVIEDVSHAHGALYTGKRVGTFGDVAAMSMMSGKGFAIGEAGMLVTDNRQLYERAVAFGHYERTGKSRYSNAENAISDEWLTEYAGLPLGGFKNRMHQLSSAVGRVQLKHYDHRMAEIQKAMNHFWDLLQGVPGIKGHRVDRNSGSTMGGWYLPAGLYNPEELGGLPVGKFCEAVMAEGIGGMCHPGINNPLHLHPIFHTADIYGEGKPTMLANTSRDIRQGEGALPVSEGIMQKTIWVPWFKHYRPEVIEEHAAAFRKVAENYKGLLETVGV